MTERQLPGPESNEEVERKVPHILALAAQIAQLPVIQEGSPEELIGYDEAGAPA
jgi:hypothetical protein